MKLIFVFSMIVNTFPNEGSRSLQRNVMSLSAIHWKMDSKSFRNELVISTFKHKCEMFSASCEFHKRTGLMPECPWYEKHLGKS